MHNIYAYVHCVRVCVRTHVCLHAIIYLLFRFVDTNSFRQNGHGSFLPPENSVLVAVSVNESFLLLFFFFFVCVCVCFFEQKSLQSSVYFFLVALDLDKVD